MFDFNNVEMQRRSMIQTGEGEVEEEGWLVGWLVVVVERGGEALTVK